MSDPLNIMLMVIILFGLAGTLLPALPGTGIILTGAIIHALLTGFSPINWSHLLILTLICTAGYIGQYLITGATSKKMGASKYGVIGACLGLIVGFILPIPGGIFAGTFIGAVAFEVFFELKDLQDAMKSGVGALAGTLLALFFEFMIGLTMVSMVTYLLFKTST